MNMLIKANKGYHSCYWPHANAGDKKWVDDWMLAKLNRDAGPGMFSVLKVEAPGAVIDIEANDNEPVPAKAEEAPKKKRGRPRKNPA